MNILQHTWAAYTRNLKLISFFSIPFLLALLIPLLSPMPTFLSAGGSFLRFGSIPTEDLTQGNIAIIVVFSLASLFLVSFALVAINIVIKSQRTLTQIRTEVLQGIEKYTLSVFWLLLTFELLYLVIDMFLFEFGLHRVVGSLITFLLSLPIFFAPAAIVIDELSPSNAVRMSLNVMKMRFMHFLLWMVVGAAALVVLDGALLALLPHTLAEYAVLVINSVALLPFLVVMQTQIYLSKYTIIR